VGKACSAAGEDTGVGFMAAARPMQMEEAGDDPHIRIAI